MGSIYTTTITSAAKKRGIAVEVLDAVLPIFELRHGRRSVRCYNGLTDSTGGASFHLAQDKGAANRFLRKAGFPVPAQEALSTFENAVAFMESHECIVVKPVSQWGGRGVSTHVTDRGELRNAIDFARRYSDEVLLEECVDGIDWRLIYVDFTFIAAIQRNPAIVTGNGRQDIKTLIELKNERTGKHDPSNRIPLDKETLRTLQSQKLNYRSVPAAKKKIQVRRTSNYHTGGSVDIVTERIPQEIKSLGKSIAQLLKIPVLGVDILYNADGRHHIIELSPDLAISPPEGGIVAEAFLDLLFPKSRGRNSRGQ